MEMMTEPMSSGCHGTCDRLCRGLIKWVLLSTEGFHAYFLVNLPTCQQRGMSTVPCYTKEAQTEEAILTKGQSWALPSGQPGSNWGLQVGDLLWAHPHWVP